MKKFLTLATLLQLSTASASVIAIMDSGTDLSHKDLAPKAWTNPNEVEGSTVDLDGSGLPGDMHGWDFTENSPKVFNDKYNYLITDDVKRFFNIYAKFELGTINQMEYAVLKGMVKNTTLMGQVDFVGSYAHGTHVGGISALNNATAQVMSLKILPTVYQEAATKGAKGKSKFSLRTDGDASVEDGAGTVAEDDAPMTVEEFQKALVSYAVDQIKKMMPLNGYLAFQKVDVVNQSFGIGNSAGKDFVKEVFTAAVQRAPTDQELVDLTALYFMALEQVGPYMFKAAPTTLFVIAAGNDSSDNDALSDYPSTIPADNKIVVSATVGYSSLAKFSNFGATKVEVAAPGVAILSTAPAQSYLAMSGTSQAAPFVTNAIAQAKDINPALTTADLKAIILGTVDVKSWLKGKVLTSGIVNKARVARAAELSKTVSVDVAIAKARVDIADVATPKSFAKRSPNMVLDYKPIRPSLLVKLPRF